MSEAWNDIDLALDGETVGKSRDMQILRASSTVVFPTPFTPTNRLNPG